MKKIILSLFSLLFLSACGLPSRASTYEGDMPDVIGPMEISEEQQRADDALVAAQEAERERRDAEILNRPLNIIKLDNGNYKYKGENIADQRWGITKYSIEFDPNKWELVRELPYWDATLKNKTDSGCNIKLGVIGGIYNAEIYEKFEDGVGRAVINDPEEKQDIVYWKEDSNAWIRMNLKDESEHPDCLNSFREVAKTFKFEEKIPVPAQ